MCFEKPFSVFYIQFLTFCKKDNQDLHFAGKSANICLALKAREC